MTPAFNYVNIANVIGLEFLSRRRRILSRRNVTRGEERGEMALLAEATNLTGVACCWIFSPNQLRGTLSYSLVEWNI